MVFDRAQAIEENRKGLALAPNEANLIGAHVVSEQAPGRVEEAARHAREAFRLDPRSTQAAMRMARTLIFLRRFDEASPAADATVRLNPASPDAVWTQVMVFVAQGDLDGAHGVYRHASAELDRVALVAFMAHI